jgi:hypothetical protein
MRRLADRSTLKLALPLGLVVALAGLPHVWLNTPGGVLLGLRLAVLVPMSVVLMQIALAWTPLAEGRSALPATVAGRDLALFLPAPLLLVLPLALWLDPLLERARPEYWPLTFELRLAALPWIGLFQPLVLVAAVYGFAARVTRNATAASVVVVLVHQAAFFAHARPLPPDLLLTGLVTSGAGALLLAFCYRRLGLPGLAWSGLILAARHLLPPG